MAYAKVFSNEGYSDLIPAGKKLYLYKGFLRKYEISNQIAYVTSTPIGDKLNMKSAVLLGFVGTALAGLIGTIIGVAAAKREFVVLYKITFKDSFETDSVCVFTEDKYLVACLRRYM